MSKTQSLKDLSTKLALVGERGLKSFLMSDMFHFQAVAEKITKAVSFANKVAQGTSVDNPSYKSVTLAGSPDGVIVRTTTDEYQASSVVEADIFTSGDCQLPAKDLAKWLEKVDPEAVLDFIYDNNTLYITADIIDMDKRMAALVPEYAQPEWIVKSPDEHKVPLDFAEDIKYASQTACTDVNRSYYGINIDSTGIVTFDDVQFTKVTKDLPGFPSTTLSPEIVKMLAAPKDFGDGDIYISSDGDKFKIRFGTSSLIGPTMAHDFASTRELIEKLIDPYLTADNPVTLVANYKKFAGALGRIDASSEDVNPFDAVLISPSGSMTIGLDRAENYKEVMKFESCDIERPFAVALRYLKKLFKEAKDELLVFHFDPQAEFPEEKQIVVIRGNRIVGMSPVLVPAVRAAMQAKKDAETAAQAAQIPDTQDFEVKDDIW